MLYTDEQIKSIQKVQLELLLKFDEICKQNNLKYHLFSGTLLGAVRHKGFIPWDDDIDVCMLRSDYEKFLTVCSTGILGDEYFLQTNKTDPASIIQFAKLRKNNTIYEMSNETEATSHKGIWIDIFPLDNVKPNTKEGQKQYKDFYKYYTIVTSTVKSRIRTSSKPWKKIMRWGLYAYARIIGKQRLDEKLNKILTQFDNEETEYVNHITNNTQGNRMKRFLMKREDFLDIAEFEFEGHIFPGPKKYDKVLSQSYGDYMTLPPEEERVSHHSIINLKL